MSAVDVNDFWRFIWYSSFDDYTHQKMIQYKIAIGTNQSGVYNYISEAIDYPVGQANIGNIPQGWISDTQCFYQSKIPVTKEVYWKVASIDTAFKFTWSQEQIALPQIQELEGKIDNVVIGPNPWRPNSSKGMDFVIFYNLPHTVTIKVYSISGGLLAELNNIHPTSGKYKWYPKNDRGKTLKSGVYIFYITDTNGHSKYLKLMVIK